MIFPVLTNLKEHLKSVMTESDFHSFKRNIFSKKFRFLFKRNVSSKSDKELPVVTLLKTAKL